MSKVFLCTLYVHTIKLKAGGIYTEHSMYVHTYLKLFFALGLRGLKKPFNQIAFFQHRIFLVD
jgi:hypothetical protein